MAPSCFAHGVVCCCPADGRLLIASASQDKNVRIWAVQREGWEAPPAPSTPPPTAITTAITRGSAAQGGSDLLQRLTRYAPKQLLHTGRHVYRATLESLLLGHEDWVQSVAWKPPAWEEGKRVQHACLLSASMDRSLMIWRPEATSGAPGQTDCGARMHMCGIEHQHCGGGVRMHPRHTGAPAPHPHAHALFEAERCVDPVARSVKNSATSNHDNGAPGCAALLAPASTKLA